MNSKINTVIRIVLGVLMLFFGINQFAHFFTPEMQPNQFAEVMNVLGNSAFMKIIGAIKILGGLGLIMGKYVPLSLTIIIAVLFNATLFHILLDKPANGGMAIILFALSLYLVYANKERFSSLLSA